MHDGGERGSEGLEHVDQDTLAMTETGRHMKWGEGGRSRMLIDGGHREGEECGGHKEPRTGTQENGMRLNFDNTPKVYPLQLFKSMTEKDETFWMSTSIRVRGHSFSNYFMGHLRKKSAVALLSEPQE